MTYSSETLLIMTSDDFGLSTKTNAGIIQTYQAGVLTCASLMVGGDAVQEAVVLAELNKGLAVGLHLSFSDTKPCAPPEQVSMLLDDDGRFPCDERLLDRALRSFKGREQIRIEIASQFKAYQDTGLVFDHVNVHRHAHLRPILAWMVFQEAKRYGINTVRIPWEVPNLSLVDGLRWTRMSALKSLGSFYHLTSPRYSIGNQWNADQLLTALQNLKPGINELYFHPITDSPGHMFENDLSALLDERVGESLRNFTLCSYQTALL